MELQFFNRENSGGHAVGDPVMSFAEQGPIRISPAAVEILDVKAGDGLELCFDKTQKQWFAVKTSNSKAFKLRAYKGDKSLQFNAAAIAKEVIKHFETTKSGASVRAIVSSAAVDYQGFKLFPLLMKAKPVRP